MDTEEVLVGVFFGGRTKKELKQRVEDAKKVKAFVAAEIERKRAETAAQRERVERMKEIRRQGQ